MTPRPHAPPTAPAHVAVGNLIAVTESLARILAEENALLENRRPRDLQPLLDEKQRLTRAYAREAAALKADPQWRTKVGANELRRLKHSTGLCQDLTVSYGRRLSAMKQVSEGLVKAIGEATAARQAPARGYDRRGAVHAAGIRPSTPAAPVSIALNQRV